MPREGQIGPISLFSSQIKKSQDLSSSPGGVMNFIDEDDNLGIPWVGPGIPKSTQWVPSAVVPIGLIWLFIVQFQNFQVFIVSRNEIGFFLIK